MSQLGLTPIGELESHISEVVNVIGVVLTYRERRLTKRGEWMQTFTLADNSCSKYQKFLTVNIFRKTIEAFPPIRSTGCILFIKALKICYYDGVLTGLSSFKYFYTLFDRAPSSETLSIVAMSVQTELPDEIVKRANEICLDFRSHFYAPSQTPKPIQSSLSDLTVNRARYKTLQQLSLQEERFDFFGEILHIEEGTSSKIVNVYLTDYTKNSLTNGSDGLFTLECGITDDMVLDVKFWDMNTNIAAYGKKGDILLCKWMHSKSIGPNCKTLTFSLRNRLDQVAYKRLKEDEAEQIPELGELLRRRALLSKAKRPKIEDEESAKTEVITESEIKANTFNEHLREKRKVNEPEQTVRVEQTSNEEIEKKSCLTDKQERVGIDQTANEITQLKCSNSLNQENNENPIFPISTAKQESIEIKESDKKQESVDIKEKQETNYSMKNSICNTKKSTDSKVSLNNSFTAIKNISTFCIKDVIQLNYDKLCSLFCPNCKLYLSSLHKECFECKFLFSNSSYHYRFVISITPSPPLNTPYKSEYVIVDYRAGIELMDGIIPTDLTCNRYTLELIKNRLDYLINSKIKITGTLLTYETNEKQYRTLLFPPLSFDP